VRYGLTFSYLCISLSLSLSPLLLLVLCGTPWAQERVSSPLLMGDGCVLGCDPRLDQREL